MGYLILNKWVDKATGEEKKLYKARMVKILSQEEVNNSIIPLTGEGDGQSYSNNDAQMDSAFSTGHPNSDMQFSPHDDAPSPISSNKKFRGASQPRQKQQEEDMWKQSRHPDIPF